MLQSRCPRAPPAGARPCGDGPSPRRPRGHFLNPAARAPPAESRCGDCRCPSSLAPTVDGLLSTAAAGDGDVSIWIQGGPGDTEATGGPAVGTSSEDLIEATAGSEVDQASASGQGAGATDAGANGDGAGSSGNGGGDRAYQRYEVHHVARWIEQILPFSLLLLVVFIRQHLQGWREVKGSLDKSSQTRGESSADGNNRST